MIRTIDRYLIRETLSPFLLALVVFTFILQIPPVMEEAKKLLEKGVDAWTILRILATLLPQALGITIPVALLVGLLISLGRLSADREAVALQACGVSLPRLLRPVMAVALLGWGITTYVMLESIPAGNRTVPADHPRPHQREGRDQRQAAGSSSRTSRTSSFMPVTSRAEAAAGSSCSCRTPASRTNR